jgi:hypothetical protein
MQCVLISINLLILFGVRKNWLSMEGSPLLCLFMDEAVNVVVIRSMSLLSTTYNILSNIILHQG